MNFRFLIFFFIYLCSFSIAFPQGTIVEKILYSSESPGASFTKIITEGDSVIYLYGSVSGNSGISDWDAIIVKLDQYGNEIWSKKYLDIGFKSYFNYGFLSSSGYLINVWYS